jgi:RNA polymerase sigma-70 factor (ECF subfamily)
MVSKPEDQPEHVLLRDEQQSEMLATLDCLGEKHRLVVILRYYGGMSNEEIARALKIPSGTVRSRLHIARQRLRAILASHEAEKERMVAKKEVAA